MHSGGIHLFVVNYGRTRLVYSARYDKYVDGGEKKDLCILFAALRALSLLDSMLSICARGGIWFGLF